MSAYVDKIMNNLQDSEDAVMAQRCKFRGGSYDGKCDCRPDQCKWHEKDLKKPKEMPVLRKPDKKPGRGKPGRQQTRLFILKKGDSVFATLKEIKLPRILKSFLWTALSFALIAAAFAAILLFQGWGLIGLLFVLVWAMVFSETK